MIFSLNKIIKKNIEITFLFFLLLIAILSTIIYNEKKAFVNENYKDLINNIYFQKSIKKIFDNLIPKYKNIDHKVSSGETFDKILSNYSIPDKEINQIKKRLNSDYDINNLRPNLEIKITIDQSDNKKVTSFLFPISRTKKIQLTKNLNNIFEKKIIITNLNKKIILKEGKITQSLYKTAIDLSVQPNVIIEFAEFMDFKLIFKEILEKMILYKSCMK